MANQTSRLIGSDRQPDPGLDSNRCAVTRERAGHGAMGEDRRSDHPSDARNRIRS